MNFFLIPISLPYIFIQKWLKSLTKASEIITGVGPSPAKQFRNAIIDGDEDRAVLIYTKDPSSEQKDNAKAAKALKDELHPSKPFPSQKKNYTAEIPLHLCARHGM